MAEQSAGQSPTRPRIAIITGGARGLGYAMASVSPPRAISSRSGTSTVTRSTRQRRLPGARASIVDVTRQESIDSAVKQILQEFGRIEVLINSAGITGPNQLLAE